MVGRPEEGLAEAIVNPAGRVLDYGTVHRSGAEPVIVEAVRTPIGRGHPEKGYYRRAHANELLGRCFRELLNRSGVDPSEIGDVLAGCVQQYGEQSWNVARNAWLQAGLPAEVPATTIDRQCGSAQQAVNFGATQIAAGVEEVVIGSGVEHMGHVPLNVWSEWVDRVGTPYPPELLAKYGLVPQGVSAELMAAKWEIPRAELDELGYRSHRLAARATEEGRFEREMMPMTVRMNGDSATVVTDQGIRPDTSLEKLSELRPAFPQAADHVGGEGNLKITAGNSSQISDGAAAVLLMSREKADRLGLRPRARIVDQVTVGVDPVLMLSGPIPATRQLLERNGMTIDDIDLIEINEAFASVVAAWRREIEPDMDRVNVNGGAIALGHPLGSTGARLVTTLLHELERQGKEYGLVTMCCGGGFGTGTLIQRTS
jgi:acetyl-CoA acyltransferase